MRQIELHIFLIEVVGLPNENQSCILNILATKRLELKSIPFLTFFFNLWPIASFPYLHQDTRFVLL